MVFEGEELFWREIVGFLIPLVSEEFGLMRSAAIWSVHLEGPGFFFLVRTGGFTGGAMIIKIKLRKKSRYCLLFYMFRTLLMHVIVIVML